MCPKFIHKTKENPRQVWLVLRACRQEPQTNSNSRGIRMSNQPNLTVRKATIVQLTFCRDEEKERPVQSCVKCVLRHEFGLQFNWRSLLSCALLMEIFSGTKEKKKRKTKTLCDKKKQCSDLGIQWVWSSALRVLFPPSNCLSGTGSARPFWRKIFFSQISDCRLYAFRTKLLQSATKTVASVVIVRCLLGRNTKRCYRAARMHMDATGRKKNLTDVWAQSFAARAVGGWWWWYM